MKKPLVKRLLDWNS